MYWPRSSVVVVRWVPRAGSETVTCAFGTTAPCGSMTVPLMLPEAPTPCAFASVAISATTSVATPDLMVFICLLLDPTGIPQEQRSPRHAQAHERIRLLRECCAIKQQFRTTSQENEAQARCHVED